jgi:hypothetical protein
MLGSRFVLLENSGSKTERAAQRLDGGVPLSSRERAGERGSKGI